MEKRISYREFQSVRAVAKAIDPKVRECDTLKRKISALAEEYKKASEQIALLEAGIVKTLGFHVSDLVVKVIEPDANGNRVTKYKPTSMVSYDDQKKQYVITLPDAEQEAPVTEEMAVESTEEENMFN